MYMQIPLRKLLGLISMGTLWFAAPASACVDLGTFRIEQISTSDAIFVGEPLAYERVSTALHAKPTLAHLKVRVQRILHGNMPAQAHLFWGSNFGIPEHLDLPKKAIFAVNRASRDLVHDVRGAPSVRDASRPSLFHLNGSPCSSEFILDDTAENVANIQKIMSGQQVPPHNYRRAINTLAQRAAKQRIEQERAFRAWRKRVVVIGGLIAVAIICGIWLRRRSSITPA